VAIEIFNRYENKYILDTAACVQIQDRLLPHMQLDSHNKGHETYPIVNLYYDTADSALIRSSLSKPEYREKLRLRSYGVPGEEVYVEIKKKFKGLVNKRRSALKLDEAYAFLDSAALPEMRPYMNGQVLREVAHMVKRSALKPAAGIFYDRRAYFGTGQSALRISFDSNIQARCGDLRLEPGIFGERLLEEGLWVMEIKVERSIPLWLCRLLSEYRIFPASFSKYGTEYNRTLRRRLEQKTASNAPASLIPVKSCAQTSLAAIVQ
jgi:hypothetical protein